MTTSPALCEVQNCGIQAVKRCPRCQRAFCLSHEAPELDSYGLSRKRGSGYCIDCYRPAMQEQANRAAAQRQAFEHERAALFASIGTEMQRIQRTHKQVPLNKSTWTTPFFGKPKTRYDFIEMVWRLPFHVRRDVSDTSGFDDVRNSQDDGEVCLRDRGLPLDNQNDILAALEACVLTDGILVTQAQSPWKDFLLEHNSNANVKRLLDGLRAMP